MIDSLIKNTIRLLITPFVLATTLIFLTIYLVFGTSFWMVMFIRLLVIYNIKIIRSVWNNSNEAANTLDSIVNFTKKHFQLSYEIIKIPMYIWQNPKNSPTQIRDIFEDEIEILKKNIWLSIGVFASLIIGFVFIFTSLGSLLIQRTKEKTLKPEEKKIDFKPQKIQPNESSKILNYEVGISGEDTKYWKYGSYRNAIKIVSLTEGMPAKNAGLRIGDIIYRADKSEIENMENFKYVIKNSQGRKMRFHYIRDGQSDYVYISPILK